MFTQTERVVKVPFSGSERAEYKKLESTALSYYDSFKEENGSDMVRRHYLKLLAKLMPLRVACSGGPIPIDSPDTPADNDDSDDDDDTPKKKRGKKAQVYSDFAYVSKLNKLIEELKRTRGNDSTCKSW